MKKDSDNYEDEENETQLLWNRVRLRNLKINLAKKMIEFEITDRDIFTQDELKNKFAFKEYDIKYLAAMLFDTVDNEYCFKEDTKSFIGKVIQSNKIAQSCLLQKQVFYESMGRSMKRRKNTCIEICRGESSKR